jgi:hypothetical protein
MTIEVSALRLTRLHGDSAAMGFLAFSIARALTIIP